MSTIKTKEEILRGFGITPETKHHEYSYLYDSVLKAMDLYAEQPLDQVSRQEIYKEEWKKWVEATWGKEMTTEETFMEVESGFGQHVYRAMGRYARIMNQRIKDRICNALAEAEVNGASMASIEAVVRLVKDSFERENLEG